MKLFNTILLAAGLTLTLSACLKDKTAEEAPAPEQTMEQPTEAAPVEAPAPADSGTTQTN